jgi:hypothetical protein
MDTIFSVSSVLAKFEASDDSITNLTENIDIWSMFGKKDSHLLRAKLFKMFTDQKVSSDTIFVIYFLFSVIKNRKRVLDSFDDLPDNIKAMASISKAKEFITNHIVQYTQQETNKKFAAVHLPTTMPGMDIMMTALLTEENEIDNKIISKQTFTQIHINSELQTMNKNAQTIFWNEVVKSSKNDARRTKQVDEELKFHESYYNTSAADKYLLVDLDFKEIQPSTAATGYSKADLIKWFKMVKDQQKTKTQKKVVGGSSKVSTGKKPIST